MERLRRSAEGGAEGPGAASGTGHTQNEAIDLPASFTLPYNQGRKVDGPSFDVSTVDNGGGIAACRLKNN
jgi:hypothetical protein